MACFRRLLQRVDLFTLAAALYIAVFVFILFPAAFDVWAQLSWVRDTGVIHELRRFGVIE